MKTRNGWVANSSSSSFIVAFDEMPKDEDELRKMMFGTKCLYGESAYPTIDIASSVWRTMQIQAERGDWKYSDGQIHFDDILDEMMRGWIKNQPDLSDDFYRERDNKKRQEILERYDQLVREHNQAIRDATFKHKMCYFGSRILIMTESFGHLWNMEKYLEN